MDTERRSVLVLFYWFSGCIAFRFSSFIFFLVFQKSSGFVPAGICWARRSRFANAAHLACFTSTRSADCAALSTRRRTCPQHHGSCHEGQGPSMAKCSKPSVDLLHICLFVEKQCFLETYGSMHPNISFIRIYVKEVIHV